jgi:hypothetical protein
LLSFCAESFGTYGERRGTYKALVRKPEGRRPLERPRHRWENNIKMYLREIGWGGAYTGLIWLRIGTGDVGSCEYSDEPLGSKMWGIS